MTDNMKNKILTVVVMVCVIICTIGIFTLIFDEHARLFYINVITTCACEIILLANIPLLSSTRLLTFKNVASSTVLDVYAILMFLWTISYSTFIEDENDLNALYIGMLILTVIFAFALGIVEIGGGIMGKTEKEQTEDTSRKKDYSKMLDDYYLHIENLLSEDHSTWKEDVLRSLKLSLDKLANIPSNKIEQNESSILAMSRHLENIKTMFECNGNVLEEDTKTRISTAMKQLANYVSTLKRTL